ncbi:MAG: hypothetical protein Kow0098_29470 [Ignavibacteriaceae bacterium]
MPSINFSKSSSAILKCCSAKSIKQTAVSFLFIPNEAGIYSFSSETIPVDKKRKESIQEKFVLSTGSDITFLLIEN